MNSFSLPMGFTVGGMLNQLLPSKAAPPSNPKTDAEWMLEAFRESLKGSGTTNPNPSVGCVIVKNGKEISRGYTQPYRGKHAERVAVEKIKNPKLLAGATVYVTLEPCSHQGHQEACSELLCNLPIKRVVVARLDSDPRVSGRGIQSLKNKGIEVDCGYLESEVTAFNLPFFATRVLDRPFFALKWAQTLDGQLADDLGYSQWISNPSSRQYTHSLRQKYDSILVGAGTFFGEFPSLNVRDYPLPSRDPLRVILDPRSKVLQLSAEQKLKFETYLKNTKAPIVIIRPIGAEIPFQSSHLIDFQMASFEIDPGNAIIQCLRSVRIENLLGKPVQSVLVEGGPATLSLFLSWGLADVLHVFIGPKLTGGKDYRVRTQKLLSETHAFELLSSNRLESDVVLEFISPTLSEQLKSGLRQ